MANRDIVVIGVLAGGIEWPSAHWDRRRCSRARNATVPCSRSGARSRWAIAAAVEQQTAATNQIAQNAQITSRGTNDVTAGIDDVTKATRQTGDAPRGMLGAADDMMAQM